ncbi:molybdopterin-dependent oxidoreductase [Nocardiopsis aegyptia]|uniref:DMSO/TMAO reductase YedYZ molybdopterin-dependent catalytic subunit n=1 Tax=Nocardiopsis aegyptia TaxID=220378 RepID=A0A7Z0ETN2_9ACTN|nr:molybdopterin-dependent oxidoreductase [Nocardiopsis aegyptia]NYJ37707.1 DMSO/TMAO reductase YedYZ molybdopterin-dependent catalytic subunit [Nocardiopsis aegyptia]
MDEGTEDTEGSGTSGDRPEGAGAADTGGPPPSRWRALLRDGPAFGPTRPGFWRSPVRGRSTTSVLGAVLLVGLTVVTVTGLLSYAAYNPDLTPVNDKTPDKGLLGFYLFAWPTDPHWLYRLTQGLHVTLGIVLVPVLLAKLWSVAPLFFGWPPVRSAAHALERLSLVLLVDGALFVFATGVLNVQLEYVFPGSFYVLHFYGSWVFLAGLAVHLGTKVPVMVRALRAGPADAPAPEPGRSAGPGLTAPDPAPATITRGGVLGLVGLGSLTLFAVTVGQSIGGPLRATALLAPRGRSAGEGPNGFQVNTTASRAGIDADATGKDWRLTVRGGGREAVLTRQELLALPQHRAALPIACVEGWSTRDQEWSGVRLADLAALVGAAAPVWVLVESVQSTGSFTRAGLRANQVADPRSLLALRVNGADLSLDHGYPARVIVPAAPGVHNTKWVGRLTFEEA